MDLRSNVWLTSSHFLTQGRTCLTQSSIKSLKLFLLKPVARGLQMVLVFIFFCKAHDIIESIHIWGHTHMMVQIKQPMRLCHKH